jgi:hypothetical protein
MRVPATALLVAAALFVAGCGGGSKSSAPPAPTQAPAKTAPAVTRPAPVAGAKDTCLEVPASLVRRLQTHLVLMGGKLSNVKAVTSRKLPWIYFVSGRVDGGGLKRLLATWATPRLGGNAPVYSVDASAALVSLYGGAMGKSMRLTVTAPGAYKSRVCVAGPGAPHGSNAPVGGNGAPSPH